MKCCVAGLILLCSKHNLGEL